MKQQQAGMNTPQISEVFHAIGKLAAALGVRSINQLPGCWEHAIDEHWRISVNGHCEETADSKGNEIAPYNCWVEFNGWPAGYFDPTGGVLAAGEAANEQTFMEAIHRAIAKAEGQ